MKETAPFVGADQGRTRGASVDGSTASPQTRAVLTRTAAVAAGLIGVAVLSGWALDALFVTVDWPTAEATMEANTAACVILLAGALWTAARRRRPSRVVTWLSATVAVVATATLLQYLLGVDLLVDRLAFTQNQAAAEVTAVGRMPPVTAVSLLLLAAALTALRRGRRAAFVAELSAGVAGAAGLTVLMGAAYGIEPLTGVGAHTYMAGTTALAVLLLGGGAVTAAQGRVVDLLTRPTPGSVLARWFLPVGLVLPWLLGGLQLAGQRAGLYGTETGTALLVGGFTVLCAVLLVFASHAVDRLDAQRRRADEVLRAFVDNSPTLIFMKDPEGRYVLANPQLEQIYAAPRDQILGSSDAELIPEQMAAALRANDLRVAQSGASQISTEFAPGVDGVERTYRSIKFPVTDSDGGLIGIGGISTDVTAELEAQEALREQTVKLRLILDSLSEGVVVADTVAGLVEFNPAARKILGLVDRPDTVEAWNQRPDVYLPDGETPFPSEERPMARALRGESVDGVEMFVWHGSPSAGIWVRESARPLRGDEGAVLGAVVVFRDITQRKMADWAMARLNTELEQRVRERTAELETANRELEAFSYSVSHDLRAPLRAIGGFSRILVDEHADQLSDEALRYLHLVRSNTQRMGRLVDDLLGFARTGRQPVERERVDVADLARSVVADAQSGLEGREVEVAVGSLPGAEADPALLTQVLFNLVDNAIKFTRDRAPARVTVGWDETSGAYFVRDNGVGFDMRYADKLFGVFQRLHPSDHYEGTGVGLATVQRIVARHGGRIWAESEPDRGATFYFTLTRSDDDAS